MRSECILCGASFATVARAPQRCKHTPSGFVTSRKSWCVSCDDFSAPVRARTARQREWSATVTADPERRAKWYGQIARHKQTTGAKNARRHREVVTQFTQRTFACSSCHGRFAKQRESWRRINGARVALGMCAFCAEQHYGPAITGLLPRSARNRITRAASAPETSLAARLMTHFRDTGAARALSHPG